MVHNPEKLELATLYRKQGFSYTEIAKLCDVSKSTVSNWFKGKAFSKKIAKANAEKAAKANKARISLLNKAKQTERQKRYKEVERSAAVEYRNYKNSPQFMAGLMLYSALGDTTDPVRLRLSSARGDLHKVFHLFMQHYMGVEKRELRFWLLLPSSQSEKALVTEWSRVLKLQQQNFYKNHVVPQRSTRQTLQSGVGNTIIGSTVLKKKLMKWIELAEKDLQK